jgi:hypothetical protein
MEFAGRSGVLTHAPHIPNSRDVGHPANRSLSSAAEAGHVLRRYGTTEVGPFQSCEFFCTVQGRALVGSSMEFAGRSGVLTHAAHIPNSRDVGHPANKNLSSAAEAGHVLRTLWPD